MAKYTIEFDDAFDKTLTDLKEGTDATTKADVIRRAVATYKVLKNETAKDGEIAVTDKSGKVKKSFILP
jgi:predicted transcriptional regulator